MSNSVCPKCGAGIHPKCKPIRDGVPITWATTRILYECGSVLQGPDCRFVESDDCIRAESFVRNACIVEIAANNKAACFGCREFGDRCGANCLRRQLSQALAAKERAEAACAEMREACITLRGQDAEAIRRELRVVVKRSNEASQGQYDAVMRALSEKAENIDENARLRHENETLKAIRNALVNLDWCCGYAMTEQQHIELDNIRTLAVKAAAAKAPTDGKDIE